MGNLLPTRRNVLAAATGLIAAGTIPARAASRRVATVDWAVLETLLAMGIVPVAATELVLFREIAVEPALPPGVADLGLRGTVNYEALLLARPDVIMSSNFYVASEPKMRRIAPVESFRVHVAGERPYGLAEDMTRGIGRTLQAEPAADALIAHSRDLLSGLRERLKGGDGRPMIPINLGDARHFRVFGQDSMFGEVLTKLGIENAWTMPTSYSAMAPIGLEALAQVPEAWIILIPPVPADASAILADSAFWNALPNVREGRVLTLGSINPFGGLPAAARFARLLVDALPYAAKA
jgi:ferric hydroxamate transport system substrate-binding protein